MTNVRPHLTESDDRPWQGHKHIDWSILGKPDELRRLLDEGQSRDSIAQMCNCDPATVSRWARLFGINMRDWQKKRTVTVRRPAKLTFAEILEHGARVCRQRLHRCWDQCPRADDCDDERCPYDPAQDVSADPWWDG